MSTSTTGNDPQPITEESGVHKSWYVEADKVTTLDELSAFIRHLLEDYRHDYGTICHALAAGAVATCWAMNRHPAGGITGFQAGAVMWEFIRAWNGVEGPARLQRYSDLLYPQHADRFENAIGPSTWEWVQAEARKLIAENPPQHRIVKGETADQPDFEYDSPHPAVLAHWQSIADGKPPFGFVVRDER